MDTLFDSLGVFLVASLLFLPVILLVPYVAYEAIRWSLAGNAGTGGNADIRSLPQSGMRGDFRTGADDEDIFRAA